VSNIKDLLTFPCEFPIKVMGLASAELKAAVLQTLYKYLPDFKEEQLKYRSSRNGRYLSITANIMASDQETIDKIYIEFNSNPLILMTL